MISLAGIACVLLVHRWLPYSPHARVLRLAGRMEMPPDLRILAWWQTRRTRTRGQALTTRLLQSLIAELQAGLEPGRVFVHVLGDAYAEVDDLPEPAPTADDHIWRDVAHVRMAAADVGFSLATALQRIHAYALTDQEVWREVQSNAAAPRLALLTLLGMPAMAWMFGGMSGASPVHFLFTNPIGWGCLVLGAGCYAGAYLWMRALTRRALQ